MNSQTAIRELQKLFKGRKLTEVHVSIEHGWEKRTRRRSDSKRVNLLPRREEQTVTGYVTYLGEKEHDPESYGDVSWKVQAVTLLMMTGDMYTTVELVRVVP